MQSGCRTLRLPRRAGGNPWAVLNCSPAPSSRKTIDTISLALMRPPSISTCTSSAANLVDEFVGLSDDRGRRPERAGQKCTRPSPLSRIPYHWQELVERGAQLVGLEDVRETDCVAGHVRLEIRNVVANYPLERSHRFPEIQPKFWTRRLFAFELRRWEAQLGPSARISAGCLRWQELPRFSAAEMIRRR